MEKLYFVKSIEISSRSVMKGDQTSVTPNFSNLKLTFENLNQLAKLTFDNVIEQSHKKYNFTKLVVTLTYSPLGTSLQHCIQTGYDEEGEIYCSQYCKVVYIGVSYRYEYSYPHSSRLAWYGCVDAWFAFNLDTEQAD